MKEILIATSNAHKVEEFKAILEPEGYKVKSLLDIDAKIEIDENGTTFAENSRIKSETICKLLKITTIADDSGLEIDYLNGEPGVYSARYLGEDTSYRIKNQNLIDRLEGVPEEKRTARFVCVIAAVFPDGRTLMARGTIEGIIGYEERGEGGFGYDPIFWLPEYACSTAELTMEKKNELSHRGKALRIMKKELSKALEA